jgi:hypothetical protein
MLSTPPQDPGLPPSGPGTAKNWPEMEKAEFGFVPAFSSLPLLKFHWQFTIKDEE